jgi:uncharacterized protein YjiK
MKAQMGYEKDNPAYSDRKIRRQVILVIGTAGLLLLIGILAFALRENAGSRNNYVKGQKSVGYAASDERTAEIDPGNVTIIKKWDLPKELAEISGLSYVDDQRMACVQDESGKVYIYNIHDHKIEKEIAFAQAGDFEGIAVVDKTAWILRADGVLFEVSNMDASKPAVKQYPTHLTADQNCEGLCYDKINERLLVTIKDSDPNSTDYKGIYSFDLKNRRMAKDPVVKIDLQHEVFTSTSTGKKNKKEKGIKPSAIAVNPTNQYLYITDGPKSRLLLTDSKGEIKKLVQLDTKQFAQPEGITFNNKGELYISNEGPSEPGNILKVTVNTQ